MDVTPCENEQCQLDRKIMLATQESLEVQIETLKQKVAMLTEENKELRRNSVNIQQQAEQEEEFISNTLLKKIQRLKQEKESLAINYEQEEEFLTNDLTKKLQRIKAEKVEMEKTFEVESEAICNKLTARINNLERQLKDVK
jgi:coiled-coil domain-containing protein 6